MKIFFIISFAIFLFATIGNAQQSIEDSLNRVIAENKDEADVSRAYNALAYEYTRKDPVKARHYLSAAITIAKKINNRKRLSNAYSQLIYVLYDGGKPDSAEYYLAQVKDLVTGADESEKDALNSNYNTVAAMFYKKTGSYQKAIPFFENAIALLIKMGDKESTAGQNLNLGNTYVELGNYKKATEKHLKALSLFEEIGSDRGISFCYQSLSNSFTQLKQYNTALLYANKSLKIKTTLNDRRGLGTAQSGLGNIYLGMGNFDKALIHFTESLSYAREQKNLLDEQTNYLSIAKVYAAKKEVQQAIEYFNKSKELAKQLKNTSAVAAIDAELIALQYKTETAELSENKLISTIDLFKQQGDLNRQATGLKNMVDFYTANKQFDKALEYTNRYHLTIDSIRNNDLQIQVKKMEEQYTVEKKEKEITLLKKDKELQRQILFRQRSLFAGAALLLLISFIGIGLIVSRNKLKQRMKELEIRNQIAADLHDEVGSSLSSIHMLSQMASQHTSEASHTDILSRMSNNAKETMDKMGDIVWMIKPGETEAYSLKQRMERFAYEISNSKNIALKLEMDDMEKIKLTMHQRKNIWLIFKEAINNAVKYSGTEKIEINTRVNNRELLLQVKDFGKGFDTSQVVKGNGLDNMQYRAAELKGSLQVKSETGKGTTINLRVPV
ncbi:MAG: sensor histidine kinase [Chitinophagaceae bacterium]|nr:sensor histidine kinase [Chitinophagaceae bacterium]MBL0068709.1 sensor histidine kinase [Chitinophagaceae bacterium]MBP6233473.1 sensor histidine kinase [Chitinophagaceae bacterium]MBP6417157.1 sensor histidine kinase [Chitinophagaceae bacterium]